MIILIHPEIPQNTGNIARTCAVTNTPLTLVRPLGFSLSSKHMKRAGLDYWNHLNIQVVDNIEEVLKPPYYFFSSKAKKLYTEISFEENAQLIFGSETNGFPLSFWEKWTDHFYTIPMQAGTRSLNLSNAVAIVHYESLRQQKFKRLL